jgi:hypothetical protein
MCEKKTEKREQMEEKRTILASSTRFTLYTETDGLSSTLRTMHFTEAADSIFRRA